MVDNYSDKDFGSWIIEKNRKRIILDGKDFLLSLQSQVETDNWEDNFSTNITDLTFKQINEVKDRFKNDK